MPIQRELTPEELSDLTKQGIDPSQYVGQKVTLYTDEELGQSPPSQEAPTKESSALGAGGRAALSGAAPAIAGGAAFMPGATAGAAIGAFGGPLDPVTVPLGFLIGGLGSSMLAGGATGYAQNKLMPEEWKAKLAQDELEHPTATTVGHIADIPLGGLNPSVAGLGRAASGLSRLAIGAPLTGLEKQALANVGAGSILGGVQEGVMEKMEGKDLSAKEILKNAAIGAAFNRPNALGKKMGFHDYKPDELSPENLRADLSTGNYTKTPPEEKAPEKIARILKRPLDYGKGGEMPAGRGEWYQTGEAKPTALAEEVKSGLEGAGLPSDPTVEWYERLKNWGANVRGTKVESDGTLSRDGKPVNGVAMVKDGIKQVLVNPETSSIDTLPHELWHPFMEGLEQSKRPEDIRLIERLRDMHEEAVRNGSAEAPVEPNAHEFSVSEQGLEFLKHQLNLGNEKATTKWWNDTKAILKSKFSNPSDAEVRRYLNYKFVNDKATPLDLTQGVAQTGTTTTEEKKQPTSQLSAASDDNYLPPKFIGHQDDFTGKTPGFDLYNLQSPIYDEQGKILHSVGSTVSESTLRKYGIEIPKPKQASLLDDKEVKAASGFAKMREAANEAGEKLQPQSPLERQESMRKNALAQRQRNAAAKSELGIDTREAGRAPLTYPVDSEGYVPPVGAPSRRIPANITDADVPLIDKVFHARLGRLLARTNVPFKLMTPEAREDLKQKVYVELATTGLDRKAGRSLEKGADKEFEDLGLPHYDARTPNLTSSVARRTHEVFKDWLTQMKKEGKTISMQAPSGGEGRTVEDTIGGVQSGREESSAEAPKVEEKTAQPTIQKKREEKVKGADTTANDLAGRLEGMGEEGEENKYQHIIDALDKLDPETPINTREFMAKMMGSESKLKYQEKSSLSEEPTDEKDLAEHYQNYSFLRPLEATFDKVKKVAPPEVAKGFEDWEAQKDKYNGWRQTAIVDLSKYPRTMRDSVKDRMDEAFRDKKPMPKFVGKEKEVSDILKRAFFTQYGQERRNLGMKIYGREAGMNETYIPHVMSPKAMDTLIRRSESPEGRHMENEWVKYIVKESGGKMTPNEALDYVKNYVRAVGAKDSNYLSVHFGALRKGEGLGLPDFMKEQDTLNIVDRYGRRASNDMAMFKHLESNPTVAATLELKDGAGHIIKVPGVRGLSQVPEIKDAMAKVTGNLNTFQSNSPLASSVAHFVNNLLMGTGTGLRDTASIPINMVPYINKFSDLGAAWSGMMKLRENSRRALETSAKQPRFDNTQFNELMDTANPTVTFFRKAAGYARVLQGRELIENFNRDLTFSIGRELARNNILGAISGHKQSQLWLKKFGILVDKDPLKVTGKDLEETLDQMAKNFTDRNQGTFGGRGQPAFVDNSMFAPFWALQKWSIEKSNVIYKDVWTPFVTGENRLPLITYTLGSILGGVAIQQLNQILSNRKGQDPTVSEAWKAGRPIDKVAELATLMQLGSFAGVMGDLAKWASDVSIYGKAPRNIVSFPTASAALDLQEKTTDLLEAWKQGEDPVKTFYQYALDLMVNHVQTARYGANHTVNADDVDRADKFRDVRVFNQMSGKPSSNIPNINPYLGYDARTFKRESDPSNIGAELLPLIKGVIDNAQGNPEEMRKGFRGLKQQPYDTMPSIERNPLAFAQYYNYLRQTQGEEAAQNRVQDFIRQSMLNRAKSSMVPSLGK